MKTMQRVVRGFNLLELMVVITLMVILMTVGYTSFVDFVMRSKVTDAMNILEEYKTNAIALRAKTGAMDPYYVLFPEGDETGWVSGTAGGTSAVKSVDKKYIATLSADSGTSSGSTYILLGAGYIHEGAFVTGADHVYIVGLEDANGVLTWKCGISASKANTITTEFLPKNCRDTLP